MKLYRKDMLTREIQRIIQNIMSNRSTTDLFRHRNMNMLDRVAYEPITIVKLLVNHRATVIDIYYISNTDRETGMQYLRNIRRTIIKGLYARMYIRALPRINWVYDYQYEEMLPMLIKNVHRTLDQQDILNNSINQEDNRDNCTL